MSKRGVKYSQPHNIPLSCEDRKLLGISNVAIEAKAREVLHRMGKVESRRRAGGYEGVEGIHNTFFPRHYSPRE